MTKWHQIAGMLLLSALTCAGKPAPREKAARMRPAHSSGARVVYLSDKDVATVYVHPGGSVLSFPAKPSKVIIGREGQFDVQYVDHDVAVVALTPASSASMFVYLLGRRYAFNLMTVAGKGERIIMVRDPESDRVEVEVK